jgi:hypothetical protein
MQRSPARLTRLSRLFAPLVLATAPHAWQQPGEVVSEQKISAISGSFMGPLGDGDSFGRATAAIGDHNGDGVEDLAVGAVFDDDGGFNFGAVWILPLASDGSVAGQQKISQTAGGFGGTLGSGCLFGHSICSLGDFDGDGVGDIVVGAPADDDGGMDRGAVWLLFLNSNGTVKGQQKVSQTAGGFTGSLIDFDRFGISCANLGDLDGDGITDLVVGAIGDDNDGTNKGAVWVLFMNETGTVKANQRINDIDGGFGGRLDNADRFGRSVAGLGDLDGDGLEDIAVGSAMDDDGGTDRGALYVLFLNGDGTVKTDQKISGEAGGFSGALDDFDAFGVSLDGSTDVDGDGVRELAIGALEDDDGGSNRGAVWLLFLDTAGTVGFGGDLGNNDQFGQSASFLGDLDGDGQTELASGASLDDDGGPNRGAVWVLYLEPSVASCQSVASVAFRNAGANPASYSAMPAILGATWTATCDLSTTGHALAIFFAFDSPILFTFPNGQTLLCFDLLGSGELLGTPIVAGPFASLSLPVPNDLTLCGLNVYSQVVHFGAVAPFALSNAQDLTLGGF